MKKQQQLQKSGYKEKIYNQYCKEKETDSYIENEQELKVLKQEPSMVIPVDQKMGRIYQHGNE